MPAFTFDEETARTLQQLTRKMAELFREAFWFDRKRRTRNLILIAAREACIPDDLSTLQNRELWLVAMVYRPHLPRERGKSVEKALLRVVAAEFA